MRDDLPAVGRAIRAVRDRRRITQAELGRRLGIGQKTVSAAETGVSSGRDVARRMTAAPELALDLAEVASLAAGFVLRPRRFTLVLPAACEPERVRTARRLEAAFATLPLARLRALESLLLTPTEPSVADEYLVPGKIETDRR